MKINPIQLSEDEVNELNEDNEVTEVIEDVLVETGIVDKDLTKQDANSKLKSFVSQAGGTLEEVAASIVDVMNRGDSSAVRLKASEFIAKLHGVQIELEEEAKKPNTQVTINIVGSENKNLLNLVMPKA